MSVTRRFAIAVALALVATACVPEDDQRDELRIELTEIGIEEVPTTFHTISADRQTIDDIVNDELLDLEATLAKGQREPVPLPGGDDLASLVRYNVPRFDPAPVDGHYLLVEAKWIRPYYPSEYRVFSVPVLPAAAPEPLFLFVSKVCHRDDMDGDVICE